MEKVNMKREVKKKCKHCGKYNKYKLQKITFDLDDVAELCETAHNLIDEFRLKVWKVIKLGKKEKE
jgi:hypothetical protein